MNISRVDAKTDTLGVMEDSIFTKIIKGEIPCHKVYEDAATFAFLDIHPVQPGHVLVVSKTQVANFYELSDDDYQALMTTVKKVAIKLKSVFPDKRRIAVIIEGLDVDHVHVKLFPIDTGEELRYIPDESTEPNHSILAQLAQLISL